MIKEWVRRWLGITESISVGEETVDILSFTLRPGDLVVVTTEQSLSEPLAKRLREKLEQKLGEFGYDNKCLIFSGGLSLDVIRPDKESLKETVLNIIQEDIALNGPTFRQIKTRIQE